MLNMALQPAPALQRQPPRARYQGVWLTGMSAHYYREVRDAERRLRGALLLDGLQADDDYFLAR